MKKCSVEECERPSASFGLCLKHYMRKWRYGTTDLTLKHKDTLIHSDGYIIKYSPGHPMCHESDNTYAYEHRVVYYDAHKGEKLKCHWCEKPLTWETMDVDHVDEDRKNNKLSNLVSSCPVCNKHRNKAKWRRAHIEANGVILEFNGRAMCIAEWARELKIAPPSIKWRLKHGWSIERTLTTPRGVTGPRSKIYG